MKRALKVIFLLTVISVAYSSPKFGERLKKDNHNTTLIDKVFRPQDNSQNQIIDKSIELDSKESKQINQTSVGLRKEENVNKIDGINSNQSISVIRKDGNVAKPKELDQRLDSQFDLTPKFEPIEITLPDVPELAGSEHIRVQPIPPPPPRFMSNFQRFYSSPNQDHNYEQSENRQSFHETAPKQSSGTDISVNIPQEFPLPNNDPRADYKKEQMGTQNSVGKPWGTKRSYTYRDPRNPHNFMEMSEVTMTINRRMNPQEAESQIHDFLVAAQSGQYGPLSAIRADDDQKQRHMDDTNESHASHIVPSEPLDPIEPNFPTF